MPEALFNRAADNWRVLLSISDDLGHGEEARSAAIELNSDRPDEDVGVVLLTDIRTVFNRLDDKYGWFGVDRIASSELVIELLDVNDFWSDWHDARPGRKLTQTDIGRLLRPFHIKSKSIWPRQRTASSRSRKGYSRDQFESAWRSYCPTDGTPAQPSKVIRLVGR
jgi:Protein of unknown function (DUF3631)